MNTDAPVLVDWYCPNPQCGNYWSLPVGELPGPCSGCGAEMLVDNGPCPKCRGAGGPPAGRERRHEDDCDFCGGTGMWPDGKPCPDGMHQWKRQRMGGAPDMAESYEVVEYCDVCGTERREDDQ